MSVLKIFGTALFFGVSFLGWFRRGREDKRKQELEDQKFEKYMQKLDAHSKWQDARTRAISEIERSAPPLVKKLKEEIDRNAPPLFDGSEPQKPPEPNYVHVPGKYGSYGQKDPYDAIADAIDRGIERERAEQENDGIRADYEAEYSVYQKKLAEHFESKRQAEQKRREYYENHPLNNNPALTDWNKHYRAQMDKWNRDNPEPPSPFLHAEI